jgi:hypothetical protein
LEAAWWPNETAPIDVTHPPAIASDTSDRQSRHDERDDQRSEPDLADFLLEETDREEERRVALPVRGGEPGERHAGGESQRGSGDERVRNAVREPASHVQGEEDPDQR